MEQKHQASDVELLESYRQKADEIAKLSWLRGNRTTQPAKDAQAATSVVTLSELAERLKMDRSSARRYVNKLGYRGVKKRTATTGFQAALTFTQKQADEIFSLRHADGYC